MSALPTDVRELLAAVVAALDVPLADCAEDDKTRAALLSHRAGDARIVIASVLQGDGIERATEDPQRWTAEQPVAYRSWQDRSKGAQA